MMRNTLIAASALLAMAAAPILANDTFSLPDLPYAYDALEPHIDEATMRVHHTGHHQAFINNLNNAVAANPALADADVESLLANVSTLPTPVRNSLGGHYNHALFWRNMAPADRTGEPSEALAARIDADFGSMEAFKEAFNRAASGVFGSGWAWLVVDADGTLAVGTTPGQDNPLMDDSPFRGTPVIGLDVWEHAYYLKHQNRRGDYLSDWWSVLNWNDANERFEAATR